MINNRTRLVLICIGSFAILIIIGLCFLKIGGDSDNDESLNGGLSYLEDMENQNVQQVENNLNKPTEAPTQPPTEAPTEPPTEPPTEELTEAPTEPPTEAPTEPPTEAPTEAPTEPPTQPVQPPIVVAGQSYNPYTVDATQAANTLAALDNGSLSVKALYNNSLFLGDSIMSGFEVYHVLPDSNVEAAVAASMAGHLTSVMDKVIQYNPKYIFLHYGLNEMGASDYHVYNYVDTYKQKLLYLKEKLPNTKIIVLAINPVTSGAIASQGRFSWIPTYNQCTRAMCQEIGVAFHQNDQFFIDRMNLYGPDGIHIQSALYPQWIRLITEEMGIY